MNPEPSWSAPIQMSVVVSTHGPDCTYLDLMLGCLLVQAHHKIIPMLNGFEFVDRLTDRRADDIHWEMLVIQDGPQQSKRQWVEENQGRARLTLIECAKVTEVTVNEALGTPGHWGHPLRQHGIEAARGRWIVLTNDDNYYVPDFLSRVSRETRDPDVMMIGYGTLNNLWGYQHHPVSIHKGQIDMGSVVVRADIAQEVKFPFRGMEGDFDYIDACRQAIERRQGRIAMISDILFVHN